MKQVLNSTYTALVLSVFVFFTLQIDRYLNKPESVCKTTVTLTAEQVLGESTTDKSSFCTTVQTVINSYCSNTSSISSYPQNDTLSISSVNAIPTDNSAVVTWKSNVLTGVEMVEFGTTPASLSTRVLEIGTSTSTYHRAYLPNIKPSTSYYYRIKVGSKYYDNSGIPFSFKTKGVR